MKSTHLALAKSNVGGVGMKPSKLKNPLLVDPNRKPNFFHFLCMHLVHKGNRKQQTTGGNPNKENNKGQFIAARNFPCPEKQVPN